MRKKKVGELPDMDAEIEVVFHPESLASIVEELKAKNLTDEEIAIEVDAIKAELLKDFKKRGQEGTFSDHYEQIDDPYSSSFGNIKLH